MKIIVLAAGTGSRLSPYTNTMPKCMVPLNGKPLLHYQLDVLNSLGIETKDIAIVGGYMQDAIVAPGIRQYRNDDYNTTNMVKTLFCAEEFMNDKEDLIIAYGDIVYESNVMAKVIDTAGDVVVAADLEWERLWTMRMSEPLEDAESFILDEHGYVRELGKKPKSKEDVEAQYIGLIKISASSVSFFRAFYHGMDRSAMYDNRSFPQMFMTSFLQCLIDNGWYVRPAFIRGGWIEIDTVSDLQAYESHGMFQIV